ncbi:acetolactate decarboxylase [Massilia mucilaginosa]|nr:acetolactate decarboxylase [Massilia mucilaginosa]
MFYALQIKGRVSGISTRAIPAQVRPYRPLAEVSKSQDVFTHAAVAGALAGIHSPSLSKGQRAGLPLALHPGRAQLRRLEVELPLNEDFARADQDKDRAAGLRKVESAQHDKDGGHKP